MKSFASFAALCAVATAVAIESTTQLASSHEHSHGEPVLNVVPYCKDCIEDFSYTKHVPADPRPGAYKASNLPSPDFNKRVYRFDEDENVFDQKEYEVRV